MRFTVLLLVVIASTWARPTIKKKERDFVYQRGSKNVRLYYAYPTRPYQDDKLLKQKSHLKKDAFISKKSQGILKEELNSVDDSIQLKNDPISKSIGTMSNKFNNDLNVHSPSDLFINDDEIKKEKTTIQIKPKGNVGMQHHQESFHFPANGKFEGLDVSSVRLEKGDLPRKLSHEDDTRTNDKLLLNHDQGVFKLTITSDEPSLQEFMITTIQPTEESSSVVTESNDKNVVPIIEADSSSSSNDELQMDTSTSDPEVDPPATNVPEVDSKSDHVAEMDSTAIHVPQMDSPTNHDVLEVDSPNIHIPENQMNDQQSQLESMKSHAENAHLLEEHIDLTEQILKSNDKYESEPEPEPESEPQTTDLNSDAEATTVPPLEVAHDEQHATVDQKESTQTEVKPEPEPEPQVLTKQEIQDVTEPEIDQDSEPILITEEEVKLSQNIESSQPESINPFPSESVDEQFENNADSEPIVVEEIVEKKTEATLLDQEVTTVIPDDQSVTDNAQEEQVTTISPEETDTIQELADTLQSIQENKHQRKRRWSADIQIIDGTIIDGHNSDTQVEEAVEVIV